MVHYHITSDNPSTHYFSISITIDHPDPAGQRLSLPNWIPGSYMIRDFSRHLLDMSAACDGETRCIEQIDKSNWRVEPCHGMLTIQYRVYARDLSVRGSYLDQHRGYYNGTSVFLQVIGREQEACEVLIKKPCAPACQNWRLATTLPIKDAESFGFGLYTAKDYDELIDHPVEMGEFQQLRFEACGIPHDIILTGRYTCDEVRLARDLKCICEHHMRFFGGPAPVNYYQFQVLVVGDGYGGLEHRCSTSLVCSRDSLPQPGETEMTDHYREFLGLCSHEYFHTWHVKRIKPACFQPYRLQSEIYTPLLWAFEGITAYYDDLALVRCGLIKPEGYLQLLAQTMTRLLRGKGSDRQSVAESSFNAWTRFYQQDENASNAIVSYYTKGCLVALCIDLKIRSLTGGLHSLDDVMRRLWQNWQANGQGISEHDIQGIISELCATDCQDFLHQLIYQTDELPLSTLLKTVGINMIRRVAVNQNDKGGTLVTARLPTVAFGAFLKTDNDGLRIMRVDEEGSAQMAGLAAEDLIIAVNGIKLNLNRFERLLLLASPGDGWTIHAFRRDELHQFEVSLLPASADTIVLQRDGTQQEVACLSWLTAS